MLSMFKSPRMVGAACIAVLALSAMTASVQAATALELLYVYGSWSGVTPVSARGHDFFTQTHGREWSCSAFHTQSDSGDFDERHILTPKQ